MNDSSQLLATQAKLQSEADAIVGKLELDWLLSKIGCPMRVGSSALGLMVRRDIDITVICKTLDEGTQRAVIELGGKLAMCAFIGSVCFRNETGMWNQSIEEYPDGLYLGLKYRDTIGEDWTFDIWFVDEPERQPDFKHLQTIPPKLTPATREAILTIKSAIADGALPGQAPSSFQVYDAVLNGNVTSLSGFRAWLSP
jgi:hypothetical protein